MTITGSEEAVVGIESDYDRAAEVSKFDDSKLGVKGLVDAGINEIPKFFIHPPGNRPNPSDTNCTHLQIPIIDLQGINDADRRKEIVNEVGQASEVWGFFQMVDHGIPLDVLDNMIEAVRKFNEQEDIEMKMELYSRDLKRTVKFSSNFDLFQSEAANWRDTLTCTNDDFNPLDPQQLPQICRTAMIEYIEHAKRLGETLFELLSEALGLDPNHLKRTECLKSQAMACHYYPACPEPDLTLGTSKHTDPAFLTILLQDNIGGLQILHHHHWVDVSPIPGALVVNIGDILQIMSNDKLKSVEHRVVASHVGPRVSAAFFFNPDRSEEAKPCGPIKELLSHDNPPKYREFKGRDFIAYFISQGLHGKSTLHHYRLDK